MSDTFTVAATRIAGIVPRLLGWRPSEIWQATPEEIRTIFASSGESPAQGSLGRAELEQLMEQDRDGR